MHNIFVLTFRYHKDQTFRSALYKQCSYFSPAPIKLLSYSKLDAKKRGGGFTPERTGVGGVTKAET